MMGTGGSKFDQGKARYDLVPPEAIAALVEVYTLGAVKYADRNWEKGINFGRLYAALMRHLELWRLGEDYDKDNGQHHLASAVWNAVALLTFALRGRGELDDLRVYKGPLLPPVVKEPYDPVRGGPGPAPIQGG